MIGKEISKVVNISNPIDERFTKKSIDWLSEDEIDELNIVEQEKTIEIQYEDGEIRKYGYVKAEDIYLTHEVILDCMYVKDLQIKYKEIKISARHTFFDGDTSFNKVIFQEGNIHFNNAYFGEGKVVFKGINFDMKRVTFTEAIFKELVLEKCIFACHLSLKVREANMIIIQGCLIYATVNMDFENVDNIKGLYLNQTRVLGHIYIHWDKNKVKKLIENTKNYSFKDNEQIEITNKNIAVQFVLLKENFHNLGQYDDEDKAYVEFKKYMRKSKLKGEGIENKIKKFFSILYQYILWLPKIVLFEWIGGYGTKPRNVFVTMMLTIIGFALAYLYLPGLEIDLSKTPIKDIHVAAIYYSGITFLTVGYGDISSMNEATALVSVFEGFLGIFLMSYFTVSFVRKLLR